MANNLINRHSRRPMSVANKDKAMLRIERELFAIVQASPFYRQFPEDARLHRGWPQLCEFIDSLWPDKKNDP